MKNNLCPSCWRELQLPADFFPPGAFGICLSCGGFYRVNGRRHTIPLSRSQRVRIETQGHAEILRRARQRVSQALVPLYRRVYHASKN